MEEHVGESTVGQVGAGELGDVERVVFEQLLAAANGTYRRVGGSNRKTSADRAYGARSRVNASDVQDGCNQLNALIDGTKQIGLCTLNRELGGWHDLSANLVFQAVYLDVVSQCGRTRFSAGAQDGSAQRDEEE